MSHRHALAGPARRARRSVIVLATLVGALLAATMLAAPRAAAVAGADPRDFVLVPDTGGG